MDILSGQGSQGIITPATHGPAGVTDDDGRPMNHQRLAENPPQSAYGGDQQSDEECPRYMLAGMLVDEVERWSLSVYLVLSLCCV